MPTHSPLTPSTPNAAELPFGLDRVFVIQAAQFVDRRQLIEAQLSGINLKFEFVVDFDIPDISDEIKHKFFSNSILSSSQQSCALKHWLAMKNVVDLKLTRVLVLEDDVILAPNFHSTLYYLIQELETIKSVASVTFLGCGGHYYIPANEIKKGQLLYRRNQGKFADSYIVSFDAARRRVNWIETHGITRPIDHLFEYIDRTLETQMFWLEPPIVEQGSHNGTFTSALETSYPLWFQSLQFRWKKIWRRRRHSSE